jgi:hypothetical protein
VKVVFDAQNKILAVYFDPMNQSPADPALEAVARAVLAHFMAGNFELAAKPFDAALQAQLTPVRMEQLTAQVAERFGTFKAVSGVRQSVEGAMRNVDLVARFDKSPAVVRLVFNPAGQVVGLHVSPHQDTRRQ